MIRVGPLKDVPVVFVPSLLLHAGPEAHVPLQRALHDGGDDCAEGVDAQHDALPEQHHSAIGGVPHPHTTHFALVDVGRVVRTAGVSATARGDSWQWLCVGASALACASALASA